MQAVYFVCLSACAFKTICVEWQFSTQHPPGATLRDFVAAAARQPCDFVFVHRACLGDKTSAVTCALDICLPVRASCKPVANNVSHCTRGESTDKRINADTAANAGSIML